MNTDQSFPWKTTKLLLAFIILFLLGACGPGGLLDRKTTPTPTSSTSFYVSPIGNDAWSGTLEEPNSSNTDGPFQTLERAKDEVRTRLQEPQVSDINVIIREGDYYLTEPLLFISKDSGHDGYQVIYRNYPGETPMISGGEVLSGWEPHDGNIFKTTVDHSFSALFENNSTSVMARFPNHDSGANNPGGNVYMKVADVFEGHEYEGFYFDPETFPVIQNADNLEVLIWNGGPRGEHHWRTYFGPVNDLSYTDFSLVANLSGISSDWYNILGPGTDYLIQNSLELLDAPGEFYRDGATLYYWPQQLPIEDQTIVAPRTRNIFKLKGSSTLPVENITIEGLDVRHTEREPQLWANSESTGAFYLSNAENITIRGNRIHNTGGYGILGIADNVHDNAVENNLIYDTGCTGVQFNGWNDSELNRQNTIVNNHIHHIGLICPHAMGIYLSVSSNNHIAHNLFHDIPNAAISIGGNASLTVPSAFDNLIEFNEIHHVMLDFQDMGTIYLGGSGPDNVIENNYIHDAFIPFSFGGGIYMDEGAIGTTVEGNLIENIQKEGNGYLLGLIEAGDIDTIIRNNIFAKNNVSMGGVIWPREYSFGEGETSIAAETPENDIDVIRNIFFNNDGPIYSFRLGDQESWLREADENLFFNARDFYMILGIPSVITLSDWQALPDRNYDKNSMIADPLFVGQESGDYRLRFDSPALALGFEELNFADMGLQQDFPFASLNNSLARMFITSDVGGNSANVFLSGGEHAQLSVLTRNTSGYVVDAGDYELICETDDATIADIDESGLIAANHSGITKILCSSTKDDVSLSAPIFVIVDMSVEEASERMPPEPSDSTVTPFLGMLSEIDFDTQFGMFSSSPSHNNWRVLEEDGNHIYCGYAEDVWVQSMFGSVEWDHYQVELRLRIIGESETQAGIQTRKYVGSEWARYNHNISSDTASQGVIQGYCGSDRCDIWTGRSSVITPGEWYLLRGEVDGNKVRTFLDGRFMVEQTLDLLHHGNVALNASPGTTVCFDEIIVRSLNRTPESMAVASRGTTLKSVSVQLRQGADQRVVGSLPRGVEVIIGEGNDDQSWVYIRQDSTGLQGWVQADAISTEVD